MENTDLYMLEKLSLIIIYATANHSLLGQSSLTNKIPKNIQINFSAIITKFIRSKPPGRKMVIKSYITLWHKVDIRNFQCPKNLTFVINKNGVLWSQACMRIEMRLRCYLVIWSLVIWN